MYKYFDNYYTSMKGILHNSAVTTNKSSSKKTNRAVMRTITLRLRSTAVTITLQHLYIITTDVSLNALNTIKAGRKACKKFHHSFY